MGASASRGVHRCRASWRFGGVPAGLQILRVGAGLGLLAWWMDFVLCPDGPGRASLPMCHCIHVGGRSRARTVRPGWAPPTGCTLNPAIRCLHGRCRGRANMGASPPPGGECALRAELRNAVFQGTTFKRRSACCFVVPAARSDGRARGTQGISMRSDGESASEGKACGRWPGWLRPGCRPSGSLPSVARLLPRVSTSLVSVSRPGCERGTRAGAGSCGSSAVMDRELQRLQRSHNIDEGSLQLLPRHAVCGHVDPPAPAAEAKSVDSLLLQEAARGRALLPPEPVSTS